MTPNRIVQDTRRSAPRATAALLAAFAGLAACGSGGGADGPTGSLAGHYELVLVNGQPAPVTLASGATSVAVLGSSLTLAPGDSAEQTINYQGFGALGAGPVQWDTLQLTYREITGAVVLRRLNPNPALARTDTGFVIAGGGNVATQLRVHTRFTLGATSPDLVLTYRRQ